MSIESKFSGSNPPLKSTYGEIRRGPIGSPITTIPLTNINLQSECVKLMQETETKPIIARITWEGKLRRDGIVTEERRFLTCETAWLWARVRIMKERNRRKKDDRSQATHAVYAGWTCTGKPFGGGCLATNAYDLEQAAILANRLKHDLNQEDFFDGDLPKFVTAKALDINHIIK